MYGLKPEAPKPAGRGALKTLLLGLSSGLCLGLAGCDLPRDPDGTLDRVKRESLRVGVSENPPWVLRRGKQAIGIEAELVEGFARSLGTKVEYHWGHPEAHLRALRQQTLELAIGGYDSSSPWQGQIGFSRSFYASEIRVGYPQAPRLELLQGLNIHYQSGSEVGGLLRAAGAHPVAVAKPRRGDGPLAAPVWELRRLGLSPGTQVLARREHVFAVNPGANRFLMALDKYLSMHKVDPGAWPTPPPVAQAGSEDQASGRRPS